MSFFRPSFENFGETLRTVSLVIGLLVTSLTGVGYAYTLISETKALAVEVNSLNSRLGAIESEKPIVAVNRKRLDNVEKGVEKLDGKVDSILTFLADFRAEVARGNR